MCKNPTIRAILTLRGTSPKLKFGEKFYKISLQTALLD